MSDSAIQPSSASAVLQLHAVEADIGGSRILRGVELAVHAGEVVALMGRNGVGKTTTLKTITGVLPIRTGTITLAGQRIDQLPIDTRARAGIGYVPQGRDIFPHLTVKENLDVALVVHPRSRAEEKASLDRVYGLFPILRDFVSRKGGVLSGGQQQQLAIARALLTNPKLLILDEPTEGIQPSIIDHIGDTLKKLKTESAVPPTARHEEEEIKDAIRKLKQEHKLAILLVEQYVDFCREVADRFYAMDRGAVTISGPIAELNDEVVRVHLQV